MSIETMKLKLTGASPLIMHNGRFVDPSYWASKELKAISSKRGKTEADLAEMAKIEFLGSLYLNADKEVILPDTVIEATLIEGARKSKRGKQAQAGMFVQGHAVLEYGEQLAPAALWEKEQYRLYVGVRIGQAKVMRMRPIFKDWSAVIVVNFDDALLSEKEIPQFAEAAGHQVGLCDWRPKHGRFTVQRA